MSAVGTLVGSPDCRLARIPAAVSGSTLRIRQPPVPSRRYASPPLGRGSPHRRGRQRGRGPRQGTRPLRRATSRNRRRPIAAPPRSPATPCPEPVHADSSLTSNRPIPSSCARTGTSRKGVGAYPGRVRWKSRTAALGAPLVQSRARRLTNGSRMAPSLPSDSGSARVRRAGRPPARRVFTRSHDRPSPSLGT